MTYLFACMSNCETTNLSMKLMYDCLCRCKPGYSGQRCETKMTLPATKPPEFHEDHSSTTLPLPDASAKKWVILAVMSSVAILFVIFLAFISIFGYRNYKRLVLFAVNQVRKLLTVLP